jgi:hypothetical protein
VGPKISKAAGPSYPEHMQPEDTTVRAGAAHLRPGEEGDRFTEQQDSDTGEQRDEAEVEYGGREPDTSPDTGLEQDERPGHPDLPQDAGQDDGGYPPPAKSANRDEWVQYAREYDRRAQIEGVDHESLTKKDLVEKYGGTG